MGLSEPWDQILGNQAVTSTGSDPQFTWSDQGPFLLWEVQYLITLCVIPDII